MYTLKHIPEDFIVEEIPLHQPIESGAYSYYKLVKRNYTTIDAIKLVSRVLGISEKYINYAGTKDRVAVTTQYLTIKNGPSKNINRDELELTYLGKVKERLNLGELKGNAFTIVVRNIDTQLSQVLPPIVNYFGAQRFGINGVTPKIGRALIKKDFKLACELIDTLDSTDNPMQQIRTLPKRLVRLYIHGYQSLIWNKAVSDYMSQFEGVESDGLWYPRKYAESFDSAPLIGFGTEIDESNPLHVKMLQELTNDNVTQRDFIIRQLPDISSDGTDRSLFVDVHNYSCSSLEDDDHNPNKKKCIVRFELGKGSYATTVVHTLFVLSKDLNKSNV